MRIRRNRNKSNPKSADRLNRVIELRLSERANKPLIKSPKKPISPATEISKIIKEPQELPNVGKPLEENKVLDNFDKAKPSELVDALKPLPLENLKPALPVIDSKELDEENRRRLLIEEKERRVISDERYNEILQAFDDEIKRRNAFKKELEIMKVEFDLYLKKKYPDIVGEKNVKDTEVDSITDKIKKDKETFKLEKERLQLEQIKRVENEKERKQKEKDLVLNRPSEVELSTFLEEEIIIEQKEKIGRNPQLDGLNDVQRTIKEVNDMELRLGRPIVPHRDIVESEESDFDSEASTTSVDILIKPNNESPFENYEDRRDTLEQLRRSLSNDKGEDDFIVALDKTDRKNGRK